MRKREVGNRKRSLETSRRDEGCTPACLQDARWPLVVTYAVMAAMVPFSPVFRVVLSNPVLRVLFGVCLYQMDGGGKEKKRKETGEGASRTMS